MKIDNEPRFYRPLSDLIASLKAARRIAPGPVLSQCLPWLCDSLDLLTTWVLRLDHAQHDDTRLLSARILSLEERLANLESERAL